MKITARPRSFWPWAFPEQCPGGLKYSLPPPPPKLLASQISLLLFPAASALRVGSLTWKFMCTTLMTLQYLYTYPFLDPHCFSSEMEDYPREQSRSFCFSKAVWSNFTNTAPGDRVEDERSFDVRQFSELCHWLRKASDSQSGKEGVSVFLKALLWEIWGRVSEPLPIDPNGSEKHQFLR